MSRRLFILCFLLTRFCVAPAQDYLLNVQSYGIEDGLSHRDVQCVLQDRKGFIWAGTKYGLNRFDGYRFKWYTKENCGLQSNEINHILEDKTGKFWLISTGSFFKKSVKSIDIFDPVTEELQSFETHFGKTRPFAAKDISCFNGNDKNELLFSTADGRLLTFDGTFHQIANGLDQKGRIESIYQSTTGYFWIVKYITSPDLLKEKCTLQVINPKGDLVQSYYDPDFDFAIIYDFEKDGTCKFIQSKVYHGSRFFQITPNGVRSEDTLAQKVFSKEKFDVYTFSQLSKIKKYGSAFWIIDGENQFPENPVSSIVDPESNTNELWKKQLKNTANPTDFFIDKSGKLWVSTQFGLHLLQLKPNYFKKYFQDFEGRKPHIRGMAEDNFATLWIVEENTHNLLKINLETGAAGAVNISETNQDKLPFVELFFTVAKAKTKHLYYQSKNDLIRFDPATYQYSSLKISDKEKNLGPIWSVYEDDYGKIWFASYGSLNYLEDSQVHELPPLSREVSDYLIYQFFKARDGVIWLATDVGLFTLDTRAGKILERYWSGGKGKNYLPFDKIFHICEDGDGSFWLGSGGSGLFHWNKGNPMVSGSQEKEGYAQYTILDGLSNNTIYAVYADDFDNLWLSSDYGIMRFNKKTLQTQAYLEEDGITNNEFNRIAHAKTSDGVIFFGGLNGVTAFDPKKISADTLTQHPPLVVTNFQQFDGNQAKLIDRTASIRQSATITLAPEDRFFLLEFSLLTFENMDNVQYAYLIEGVDKDWAYQKENSIRLSRLPYGRHLFRIKGQSPNGQWSKNELAIAIVVLKPFYLQTWFLLSALALLIASTFSLIRFRTRQLKQQKVFLEAEVADRTEKIRQQAEELKSLEQLKSRFFANVSHELRTPLTLMLGPAKSLLSRDYWKDTDRKLLEFIEKNGRQLLKLVNEILDLSKLESGKLQVETTVINFYDFLQPLVSQFSSFGDSERVHLAFDYRADPDLNILLDTGKFEKIVHNFLSNAMKFTPKGGSVTLAVATEGSDLLVTVADTGPGIHPDDLPYIFDRFYQSKLSDAPTQGGTGIGLSLCKELAELLGGEVWAESEQGKGSVFYFKFPKTEAPNQERQAPVTISPADLNESSATRLPSPVLRLSSTAQATILVVEDNPDLRAYLQVLLSDYHIITAENGKKALDVLASLPIREHQGEAINLIISDLMMPVMDGFTFLEQVKALDAFRHIPVIMLTARADVRVKLKALRIGVDDYLTKPFEEEELKARIENLLRNYRERMALFAAEVLSGQDATASDTPVIAQVDAGWLEEVELVFSKYLSDSILNLNFAADQLNLSERQFSRRIKQLTGLSPNLYLQEMRLQKARDLLSEGRFATIKETSFAVGFQNVRYFSDLFTGRFGIRPSDFQG